MRPAHTLPSPWRLLVAAALLVAGCREPAPARTPLVVFAASSLTDAFPDIESAFEARAAVDVQLTFGGSQTLRLQIEQGAPAAVFASANRAHMQALVDGGRVDGPQTFAHNRLVIAVPREGSPVQAFADLSRAERLVIGTDAVPVGRYARQMLDKAGADPALGPAFVAAVRARIVSEESNVRLARAKVELGEADAAIVYRTDVEAAERIAAVPIPEALDVPVGYVIGTVPGSDAAAAAFVRFVTGPDGQAILRRHGFAP